MWFRHDRDVKRHEVLAPLLWSARTRYRPPDPAAAAARREVGDPTEFANGRVRSALIKYARAHGAPVAPAPWPIEACLLAAEAAVNARLERYTSWKSGVKIAAGTVPAFAIAEVRTRVESRRAHQLGLTCATAPRRSNDAVTTVTTNVPSLLWFGYVRLRGWKVRQPPWWRWLAMSIIREVDRRRSWKAAARAVRGSG